ncbi:hypothetical protein HJC23_009112, partial [Cyclotella cryptica]
MPSPPPPAWFANSINPSTQSMTSNSNSPSASSTLAPSPSSSLAVGDAVGEGLSIHSTQRKRRSCSSLGIPGSLFDCFLYWSILTPRIFFATCAFLARSRREWMPLLAMTPE